MPRIIVSLNGTDENPYHRWGLSYNPFPQLGKHETVPAEFQLASLAGDPIPKERPEEYIRGKLRGFTKEFVDLCVQNYRPGELVKFSVSWGG